MNHYSKVPKTEARQSRFASFEEFQSIFMREAPNLFRLAYLLTANWDLAVASLLSALDDCLTMTTVARRWANTRARRAVIRSSVRILRQRKTISAPHTAFAYSQIEDYEQDEDLIPGLQQVFSLPEFERLVYTISVLEGYSKWETALLLGIAAREVVAARTRAMAHVSLLWLDNHAYDQRLNAQCSA